ncbi:MarR family transcriptional regulator [Rhodoferax sp. OV413]|uniref:MarR family transcriptional regulator n=1 Tax=Rhodoferax sp. OV413 TaxID=1855285 RepID=UPI0035161AD8
MTTPALSPRHYALLRLIITAGEAVQPGALEQVLQVSRPTINRALRDLLVSGCYCQPSIDQFSALVPMPN